MAFDAKILADSESPDGVRLTTFEITFPRYVQAELNTHKMLSKNSGSSRAIPVEKMLERIQADPYIPVKWGKNQKGMQADEVLDPDEEARALVEWLGARDSAVKHAMNLMSIGLHKQDANRILEPWMWQTVILSGTEWPNFWHLRDHDGCHPGFRTVVAMMRELYVTKDPKPLAYGRWHLPLVDDLIDSADIMDIEVLKMISAGRCARVSYLTHDGKRDLSADIALCKRLTTAGHLSPLEHIARPINREDLGPSSVLPILVPLQALHGNFGPQDVFAGNYRGWMQMRKLIPNEHDMLGAGGAAG